VICSTDRAYFFSKGAMKTNKQKISNRVKEIINFLIEVNKAKEQPRTGLVVWRAKHLTTTADHIFRTAFVTWIFAPKTKLNIEKTLKIALAHDICDVYARDLTPLFYYLKRTKKIMRWFRFSKEERERKWREKFEIEKKSLLKLMKFLEPKLKNEIFSSWFNYEKWIPNEGRFVKQCDRIDTLLECVEEIGTNDKITGTGWWEGTEEIVENPSLLEFLKVIQDKFYGRKFKKIEKEKELKAILDFLSQIGKMKRMPRRIWQLLGVKDSLETVAGHVFSISLMAWIFGREKKELNMERLLKMALCHEIAAVYTNDLTPYDSILTKGKEKREVFKKWLHLPRKEKEKIHFQHYRREKKALKKLTLKIKTPFKKEIIRLFDEYKTVSSAEARFLNQVNVLAVLLQALLYWKKDKKLQIDWMWEWALEKCEDPIILESLDTLKEKFY